ncbi:MAG: SpoIIIAH-like family protein [Clostridia bacterium]|nr:SpoIIIAH-like family protein [Clostridia bacterium]
MKKFFKGVRGKQLLVSVLAVMVIVAGYYRWSVEQNESLTVTNEVLPIEEQGEKEKGTVDEDYFSRARYERDCTRSEAVEILTVSAISGDASAETNAKIEQYAQSAEKESVIENMIMAKGYADCVAFVDDESVSVVVKAENLDKSGVSKIKDIVVGQTGMKATQIKISSKQ